jgi:hypothetical protein
VSRRYIRIGINETLWLGQAQCVLHLIDYDALREDGYELSNKGEQFFNDFFQQEIFSQVDFRHMIESGLKANIEGAQQLMDAVEQCFDRFDRTHIVTAEQVLLQYCGMIEEETKEAAPEIHSETERKWISNQEVIIKQAGIIETQRNMIASLKEENEHLSIAFADERAETNSLRKKLQKKKKHRSLGDRLLQLVGFVYWIVDTICN